MIKLVNIWKLDGRLVAGGFMSLRTLLSYVEHYSGDQEAARVIWDANGTDYCYTLKVSVHVQM